MEFIKTEIPDVLLIRPEIHGDNRGFVLETFREDCYLSAGINQKFVQDNRTGSQQGILRGLHYQIKKSQGKMVSTVIGEIFDVAVDLRKNSPTFGKWVGTVVSAENKYQFWIPPYFAHGFYVLSEFAEVIYKLTDYYAPQFERTIMWNDPSLNINWPLINGTSPILSEKDKLGNSFLNSDFYN